MTDRDQSTLPECENQAIETYFDGDRALFMAFRESCVEQFDVDLAEGDAAIEDNDAPSLRRVAHSLKGVLRTIGYDELSDVAKAVENAAHQNQWEPAVSQWQQFSQGLRKAFGI
jgi:HPt (histidine-containing phosphotransfer) domain-containing protein